MLCNTIGSLVSSEAASKGSAAFLFPAGVTSPFNGTPPSIMNLSMFFSRGTSALAACAIVRQFAGLGKKNTRTFGKRKAYSWLT